MKVVQIINILLGLICFVFFIIMMMGSFTVGASEMFSGVNTNAVGELKFIAWFAIFIGLLNFITFIAILKDG